MLRQAVLNKLLKIHSDLEVILMLFHIIDTRHLRILPSIVRNQAVLLVVVLVMNLKCMMFVHTFLFY